MKTGTQPGIVESVCIKRSRRNRIVHQLWRKGFSFTNRQTKPAAHAAVMMYGVLIDWLETFDPEMTQIGLR